jgi:putative ABC transport system permease protein
MPDWKSRIAAALSATGFVPDEDVIEELALHAAAAYERERADGSDEAAAARRVDALIASWSADAPSLRRRSARHAAVTPPPVEGRPLAGLVQDVRYGLRLLVRQRAFAVVAITTMALGIGASTTLFSIAYGVLLKPLPWSESDRLVRLSESRQGFEPRVRGTITNGTYIAWRDRPSTIESIAGWTIGTTTAVVGNDDAAVRLKTASVTPSLFTVLRATPLRGRVFVEDDGKAGGTFSAADVIILSFGLWQEWFGGADAIGRSVRIGGKPLTIVGIMPSGFAFPDSDTRAWTPRAVVSVLGDQGVRRLSIFSAMARLRPGVTPAQAAAEGTSRARSAPDPGLAAVAMFGGNGPAEIAAVPAVQMMTADVRPALLVLLAAVFLLLASATANVASLQLARAATRRREIAIRAAIGAGLGRLTRQLVVESSIVCAAGGALGLALALALHRALPSLLPADFPRVDAVTVDARVMTFAIAISIATGIVCGMLPALHARRLNLVESLADAAAAPVGGGMRSATARTRALIIAGQIAAACVLLVGAALLTRSFVALLNADRGYDPKNLLTARLPMPADFTLARRTDILERIASRLKAVPGVREVGFGNALPFVSSGGFRAFKMRPPSNPSIEIEVNTVQRVVSPGFFGALGLRVVAGRPLADSDTMTAPQVIVVNRSFAAKYLGDRPIGAVVPNLGMCRGDDDRWQVVGVVEDMRQGAVTDPPQPEIFMPFRQIGCPAAVPDPVVVIRTVDDPVPFASTLRALVRDESTALALDSVMTMDDRLMTNLAKPRLYAVVLAGFGGFALAIAGVGLFGVLSYVVAQRMREIGVRTALGARPVNIVTLLIRQIGVTILGGMVAGLWLAFAATRWLRTALYGVDAHDLASFAGAAALLTIASVLACVAPALRAARVDPLKVLRG